MTTTENISEHTASFHGDPVQAYAFRDGSILILAGDEPPVSFDSLGGAFTFADDNELRGLMSWLLALTKSRPAPTQPRQLVCPSCGFSYPPDTAAKPDCPKCGHWLVLRDTKPTDAQPK